MKKPGVGTARVGPEIAFTIEVPRKVLKPIQLTIWRLVRTTRRVGDGFRFVVPSLHGIPHGSASQLDRDRRGPHVEEEQAAELDSVCDDGGSAKCIRVRAGAYLK